MTTLLIWIVVLYIFAAEYRLNRECYIVCVGSMFFVRIPFAYISIKYLAPFYTRCNLVQRYMCASIGGDELCVCAVRVQGVESCVC